MSTEDIESSRNDQRKRVLGKTDRSIGKANQDTGTVWPPKFTTYSDDYKGRKHMDSVMY